MSDMICEVRPQGFRALQGAACRCCDVMFGNGKVVQQEGKSVATVDLKVGGCALLVCIGGSFITNSCFVYDDASQCYTTPCP
jgi:hypothetical protein